MARRSRSSRHLAFRAKVILQCAEKTSTAVAQDLHTTNVHGRQVETPICGAAYGGLVR